MNTSDYQQEFDKIIARKYFDKTLEKTRKEAFSKFLNLGIPTKKWENWRHTDLSLINKQNFRISEKHDAPNKELNISDYDIENCYTVVIKNGHYIKNEYIRYLEKRIRQAFGGLMGNSIRILFKKH